MVVIRSVDEIILSLIDFFKIAQPDLDLKPATVARDLVVDAPANQLALLYDEISKVSTQQSLRLVIGSDLDKLAKNFGITRNSATPASGVGLLTFSSIPATVNINKGDLVSANNGFSFTIVNGVSVNPASINFYRSVATKFRNDLDFVGISDQYAVEVTCQATTPGVGGNIPKYSLSRTSIAGVSNITNVVAFTGGLNQEDDPTFRNRVLSLFSGSSIGTALGYKNVALATIGVADAFVVEPGDPLMTRDGSIVAEDNLGNLTVVSEGTGGKVDVVVLGSNLVENVDSFIYRDKSNNNDPTSSKNNIVLGQISGDENKTISRRRIDNIKAGVLPSQPIENIIQVSGSSSGIFKEKTVDSFGRVSGNYELIKDTGVYGGSPFGFDTFHWVSNKISLFEEDRIKGKFNGQDTTTFSDVLEIPSIQQNISITNENSIVLTTDRSLIQLLHTPATNVTRVFNTTTGERYTIVSQNFSGTGTINTSGIIKISGSTLPSQSDVLQVDYSWILNFDQFSDYDGRVNTNNSREVTDSIDWGYCNLVRDEIVSVSINDSNTYYVGNTTLPISSVIYANYFNEVNGIVVEITSGIYTGRLSVVLSNLLVPTESLTEVYLKNTQTKLYNTSQADGLFTNSSQVVGIYLQYKTTIILPTDTTVSAGEEVSVILNSTDLFNITGSVGNFSGTQITIPISNLETDATIFNLKVSYIANIQDLISTGITTIPFSRLSNGYLTNSNIGFNNYNSFNISRRENKEVQKNGSNQYYIELNITSLEVASISIKVLTVVRLSDMAELWNDDQPGTITTVSNIYQLILNGYNSPSIGDKVLVIYYADDFRKFQPFVFDNQVFAKNYDTLQYDPSTNKFSTTIHSFTASTGIEFEIIEPNSNIILETQTDGYILTNFSNLSKVTFGSLGITFEDITDLDGNPINLLNKKIRISNNSNINNNGIFDIISHDVSANTIVISNNYSNLSVKQISMIRLLDGKELWSDSGEIDLENNQLIFDKTSTNANALDNVLITYYTVNNLKQTPTKIAVNITDQIINTGILTIAGTTLTKVQDIVFSATTTSLKQNLSEAMRKALGLNSNASIPSTIKLAKIAKLERITPVNNTSNEVLLVKSSYGLIGTKIQDSSFYLDDFITDSSLNALDFVLPNTSANRENLTEQVKLGDKFRITFYYTKSGETENLIFTRNGTLYTNKNFALIDKVYISSGFNASQSARFTLSNFNQPITGSRYKVFYDYLAPKQNERINIRTNYNKVITDVTFNIENNRPINADVIARAAKEVDIDVVMNIVVTEQFINSAELVKQNVVDALILAIDSNQLGAFLDASSLINTAFSVEGVGGARIIFFNKTGIVGQVLSLQAKDDEYFIANSVIVNQEVR